MSTRSFYGSTENILYKNVYSSITSTNTLISNDTCSPPQSCSQCGCSNYYVRWIWDATGEVEGSMPAWFSPDPYGGCPGGCIGGEYPSSSGTYDRQTIISYCMSPTTTSSP